MYLSLFSALAGQAQTTGAIAGIVVDANSNKPVRRASITLSTVESQPQDALAWTDGEGRFSFGYLPAGAYLLRVFKAGYQPAAYGTETPSRPAGIIQLAADEIRNDFLFRLKPPLSISGRVLDEDGDALANVLVTLLTPGIERRKRKLIQGIRTTTDSNGRYRLTGFVPGRYAVQASPQYNRALRIQPEVAAPQNWQPPGVYQMQYFPGVEHPDAAAFISVQTGQEIAGIDFRLRPRVRVQVQAKIVMPFEIVSAGERSVIAMGDQLVNGMSMWNGPYPPGIEAYILEVPPGTYVLVGQAKVDGRPLRGVKTVEIGPGGPSEIAIPVEAGIDLAGSVTVEGAGAEKFSASSVNLEPGDGIPWNGPALRASVDNDGRFKIAGVPPGIWDIGVNPMPPDGYIKSMKLGDQDVLTEDMNIHSSTSDSLKIVIGTQAAILEGTVTQERAHGGRAFVVLAPEGRYQDVREFYHFAVSDDKGNFEIKNVTPGRYRVYAFEEADQRSVRDAEYLKPFESAGTALELREGKNELQKIPMIAAGAVK